ncbi:lasso peptide biosynthesis B2 protein [Nocardioides speluncae]|uniref:lasso peptide biosynthesis B2 protein n=1 Tax=Nocardioides speluncae TaxID=2670337 RepID=UPI000D6999B1|nr:lasso peptide biosynthesis B2 protein [Nocardioides speluncae]
MSTPMATHRERLRRPQIVLAMAAVVAVKGMLSVSGFERTRHSVAAITSQCQRPADPARVGSLLQAVDAAAIWMPFRVACLERSLAVALVFAVRGRGVTWCVGVRTQPLAMHAWLCDISGEPIGESPDVVSYRPMIVISPPAFKEPSRD